MLRIAVSMLMGDRVKYLGLVLGVAFTAFLGTFAAAYASAIMTRGFALVSENPQVDGWVMDPAVSSAEQTIAMPDSALDQVRSVEGVAWAVPMCLASADVRFPDGRFQPIQLIGVDTPSLVGVPLGGAETPPESLRAPDAALVAAGGTEGKLLYPARVEDRWPPDGPRLGAPTREMDAGDEILVNDHRVRIAGRAAALPRFPPRPLLYTTYANALRILPVERHRTTFILVGAKPGVDQRELTRRISQKTRLAARTASQFKSDTVWWFIENSEDVGDMAAMLWIAVLVGLGSTGVLLLMFTRDNLKHYAVLAAMGTRAPTLIRMVCAQAAACALLGTGIGVGACALVGRIAASGGFPFRMMWFTPLVGASLVIVTALLGSLVSLRPVFKVDIATVFAGR
jgi:putative ABC transport system permease protein